MRSVWLLGALAVSVAAVPHPDPGMATAKNIRAESATATNLTVVTAAGSIKGNSSLGVESFIGIPYAEPPVGQLRLKPPKRLETKLENFNATSIAASCPQFSGLPVDVPSQTGLAKLNKLAKEYNLPAELLSIGSSAGQEDCLTLTVQRPSGAKAGDKLPVLFWIYGGGFQSGSTTNYDATSLLAFAKEQRQDFIFVAVNYRLGGFGFLPGAEILKDGSANLGLLDQRMGLQWTADNIASFGGDPEKVTIWGESAGSMSVFNQMALYNGNATYKGKPLFRGAIMNSGSVVPTDPVDSPKAQEVYDQVVETAGCAGKNDTLACLREADYDTFLKAANSLPGILSFQSLALSYLPRPDGTALPDSPTTLAEEGRYHAVPMIIGDQEDEGTLFALFQSNLSSTADIAEYLNSYYFRDATAEEMTALVETYDPSPSGGSPFRTGLENEWYPGYKRIAALLGDLVFTLTRRYFLEKTGEAHPDVPSWSYLSSYYHDIRIMGTFHGSDILQIFFGVEDSNAARSCRTYYFNFLHNLDPNVGLTLYAHWPQWLETKNLMWFNTTVNNFLLADDFRMTNYEWIKAHMRSLFF